jgi:type IV fimbrial biogenesis protein FimT
VPGIDNARPETSMRTHRPARCRRRQLGLTMVELCTTCTVAATLVGTAVPSYRDWVERKALEGRAFELGTDLQLARSEAVSRNTSLRMSFASDAQGSCYVVHTGAANACSCLGDAPAVCSGGAQAVRSAYLPARAGVRVQPAGAATSVLFDAVRGTVTPTLTVQLTDQRGRAIHQVVNVMGRVRACSPHGRVPGVKAC